MKADFFFFLTKILPGVKSQVSRLSTDPPESPAGVSRKPITLAEPHENQFNLSRSGLCCTGVWFLVIPEMQACLFPATPQTE